MLRKILIFFSSIICTILVIYIEFIWQESQQYSGKVLPPMKDGISIAANPWDGIPEVAIYLRMTSSKSKRWESEYQNVILRMMKLFLPPDKLKLLVVLDEEKQADHELGDRISKKWPYPDICYRGPNPKTYRQRQKARMYWDMLYPDLCTNLPYVCFIDTDTFFDTFMTPNLLFENGKPVVVAKIGIAPYPCWANTTAAFLRKKEVLQCMATFPVMMKTEHVKEMREVLAREQGKDFDTIFMNVLKPDDKYDWCMCQFSMMCNYAWYYHRNEYSWHLQMVPNANIQGTKLLPSQVPVEYFYKEVKPEEKIPIPRPSIHLRFLRRNGRKFWKETPPVETVENFIKEGLCYSAGFRYCPVQCRRWNVSKVHWNLYSFEFDDWSWDNRCITEQKKHYEIVSNLVNYYVENRIPVFGLNNISELCKLIS